MEFWGVGFGFAFVQNVVFLISVMIVVLANSFLQIKIVGKFRPQLIELTSFKSKLLIRFIMNKTC